MTSDRTFYCSLKFNYMSVDLEHRAMYSCCSATPSVIKIEDITANGLINNSKIINERQMMLNNQRVDSCESFCWAVEDKNLLSSRLMFGTDKQEYFSPVVDELDTINIVLGSRCNLTCSYCCKNYSRSWLADIQQHGDYPLVLNTDRYTYTSKDKILSSLSQNKLTNSELRNKLLDEVKKAKSKKIDITGGEPFLYENELLEIIESVSPHTKINVFTGAGLPKTKFEPLVKKLGKFSNVSVTISAENINKFYEFNRYGTGNSYQNFLTNVEIVKNNLPYGFASTFSNLTIFGFLEFVNLVGLDKIHVKSLCADPSFLHMNILDPESKNNLRAIYLSDPSFNFITSNLTDDSVDINDRRNLAIFLKEFSSRRKLSLEIFPKSFLSWINVV